MKKEFKRVLAVDLYDASARVVNGSVLEGSMIGYRNLVNDVQRIQNVQFEYIDGRVSSHKVAHSTLFPHDEWVVLDLAVKEIGDGSICIITKMEDDYVWCSKFLYRGAYSVEYDFSDDDLQSEIQGVFESLGEIEN